MSRNHQAYVEVVERLVTYRKHLSITQREMGDLLNVTQSHYSKLETGMKVISEESLREMGENGLDVEWLITGEQRSLGYFEMFFEICENYEAKIEFLEAVLWLAKQEIRKLGMDLSFLNNSYRILNVLKNKKKGSALWKAIRVNENLTQMQMADLLEINVKRYRRIEKGISPSDASILASLYTNLGYSPLLVLNYVDYSIKVLDNIWELFDKKTQMEMEKYLGNIIQFVNVEAGRLND